MRTLSSTLLASQKKAHRLPYVEAKVYDYEAGIKRLTWTRIYEGSELDNHHGGVILMDGYLYGSCVRPVWVCLEWKTGRTMYTAEGVGKGSLTYADGMLYTLGENSKMGLVKPTPAGHDLISEFRIPAGGEGPSWAHPVVCGGRLYIRHGGFLYAYDVLARE